MKPLCQRDVISSSSHSWWIRLIDWFSPEGGRSLLFFTINNAIAATAPVLEIFRTSFEPAKGASLSATQQPIDTAPRASASSTCWGIC
jgi:hypothetical protein